MNCISEYVSSGHPDKTADCIASYLLDEYIKHDPKTRFALEVQLKDHCCNLAGEVTSRWQPTKGEIQFHVQEAIRKIGYTGEYAKKWPTGSTLNADEVFVNDFIGKQSPDIAQGVDRDGWGDQGACAGMATFEADFGYMPRDRYFAHEIGKRLYKAALSGEAPIGLDIKVLVSIPPREKPMADQIVVAAPMLPENEERAHNFIADVVKNTLAERGYEGFYEIIINGTGAYVVHASVGDAGVVGRKLAVDFYGLNCPIGGGTTWGKDGTKADVTLNLYARYLTLLTILKNPGKYEKVLTKIGCCIGSSKCLIAQFDEGQHLISEESKMLSPSELISKFGLDGSIRKDMFFHMCKDGLFFHVDAVAERDVEIG